MILSNTFYTKSVMSNTKSTRTLILEESEIISLLAILDFYKGKVMCYPNNHKLVEEVLLLEENIIFQSNRELDLKEKINP